jgi:hypothetical protein
MLGTRAPPRRFTTAILLRTLSRETFFGSFTSTPAASAIVSLVKISSLEKKISLKLVHLHNAQVDTPFPLGYGYPTWIRESRTYLRRIVGTLIFCSKKKMSSSTSRMAPSSGDASSGHRQRRWAAVVKAIMSQCQIVPRGPNTAWRRRSAEGGIALLTRLIDLEIDLQNRIAIVEPGVINSTLRKRCQGRPFLCAGPEQSGRLLHRRQRGEQLRRAAHPRVRRDDQSCARR